MLECPVCRSRHPEGTPSCPADGSALLPEEAFLSAEKGVEPGTMIGEYRVEKKLGEGSFGAVYAGVQPLIGKKVAIKLLHKRMSAEPEVVARFIGEARAVNRIGHRNIIDVFSFGVYEGNQHYFVMELCDGLTLAELLEREGRLPLSKALPILRGIADGLDAAHAAGVTHRDLKPDNVFLVKEKDGSLWPKLLDFGVAKLASEEGGQKTATGIAIGTPRYMAPEQSRGKKVDHRADIYALGVVSHEMLTGKPLFEGDGSVDLLFKHATEPPPPMSSVEPSLSPELDAPVLSMLQKKASARPNSAGAAIAALEAKAREVMAAAAPVDEKPAPVEEKSAPVEEQAAPRVEEKPPEEPAKDETKEEVRGTGTVAMPVSPTGTLLGDPLPMAERSETAAAPAIPVPPERPSPDAGPQGRRGVFVILAATLLGGAILAAFMLGRKVDMPLETPTPKASEAAAVAPAMTSAPEAPVKPVETQAIAVPAASSVAPAASAAPVTNAVTNATSTKTTTKRRLNKDLERPKEIGPR